MTSIHHIDSGINLIRLFQSDENLNTLTGSLYMKHREAGFNTPIAPFKEWVKKQMCIWINKHDLNDFEILGVDNWLNLMDCVNQMFIRDYESQSTAGGGVVPNKYIQLSSVDEDELLRLDNKYYRDMLASDYNKVDVWATQNTYTWNSRNRLNNRINIDTISRHRRNYDRNLQDGFKYTYGESSLENNHTRGYGAVHEAFVKNTIAPRPVLL